MRDPESEEGDYEFLIMRCAMNEIGCATLAWLQGVHVTKVRLPEAHDDDQTLSFADTPHQTDKTDQLIEKCRGCERTIRIGMGGPIAEGIFAGELRKILTASANYKKAYRLLDELVGSEAERVLVGSVLMLQTRQLIRAHWHDMNRLAMKLVKQELLHSADLNYVLGPYPTSSQVVRPFLATTPQNPSAIGARAAT